MNVYDDCLARLDLYNPLRIRNIPLEVKIIMPVPDDIMEYCRQEVATKSRIIHPSLPSKEQQLTSRNAVLADYHDDIVRALFGDKYGAQKGGETYEIK